MNASTYRDMHLLSELMQRPRTTQRELSKRIGAALGLTNLMLRRLVKKGYIKITGTKRNRIRYLITPTGIAEKTRLTYEYVDYSLQLYGRVRHFLREQLVLLAQTGHRRVLLYGTGEMAEIAFLTVKEVGLELVGVVERAPQQAGFLGYPVQAIGDIARPAFDRLVVCSLRGGAGELKELLALDGLAERLIILPLPGLLAALPPTAAVVGTVAPPMPTLPAAPEPAAEAVNP